MAEWRATVRGAPAAVKLFCPARGSRMHARGTGARVVQHCTTCVAASAARSAAVVRRSTMLPDGDRCRRVAPAESRRRAEGREKSGPATVSDRTKMNGSPAASWPRSRPDPSRHRASRDADRSARAEHVAPLRNENATPSSGRSTRRSLEQPAGRGSVGLGGGGSADRVLEHREHEPSLGERVGVEEGRAGRGGAGQARER